MSILQILREAANFGTAQNRDPYEMVQACIFVRGSRFWSTEVYNFSSSQIPLFTTKKNESTQEHNYQDCSQFMIRPADRIRMFPKTRGSSRVGAGVFDSPRVDRVGSGGFQISRVGSGWVGSGRVGSGRLGSGCSVSGRVRSGRVILS